MDGWRILELIIVACFILVGQWGLVFSSRRWERKSHVVRTIENLCDEFMHNTVIYWSTAVTAKNRIEMQILVGKIDAYHLLIIQ